VRDHLSFCGHLDRNLSALETLVPVVLTLDGDVLRLAGAPHAVESATEILGRMRDAANGGALLTPDDVALAVREQHSVERRAHPKTLYTTQRGKDVRPKTEGQRRFVDAVEANTLTFGIGPAGTGKTFLAVALAAAALSRKEVNRIILTRPAVEAGEALGFLPGDLRDKILPYLRPLYDALQDMLEPEEVARLTAKGVIEIAPLAYMRGRTLAHAFVVLDEAQNTTSEQMMMFLTRLGEDARMVITGDVTQIDLPRSKASGLLEARQILREVPGVDFHAFSSADVVRHPLVRRIIDAYARHRASERA
jgi:phosphate starvation-inducible PhoH-like protein